ncbi:hypothetical protein SmJEL517_g00979 [Synchytrium microbalum]|uniref:Uncharacterized protein n=1 Tax=Synchytrium microbalum TaxID=1806994 RepID=A0A507CC73_9FUNG|nr:uncharacterized protein SmJEL517_g00979 [Synchytrium microbalum]TPX36938.1 hypothetical protein SmJEL517_g00979 [Synchytrium microbalum]
MSARLKASLLGKSLAEHKPSADEKSKNEQNNESLSGTRLLSGSGIESGEFTRTGIYGIVSNITYSYLSPLLSLGNKRPLETTDMYELNKMHTSEELQKIFEAHWFIEAELEKTGGKPSIFRAIWKTFGTEWMGTAVWRLIADTCAVGSPIVLLNIIKFLQTVGTPGANDNPAYGYGLAGALLALQIIQTLAMNRHFAITMTIGFKLRSALVATLYRKSQKLSPLARQTLTVGKIINIVASDTARLDMSMWGLHWIWAGLYQIILATALLIYTLGPVALIGFALFVVFLPVQTYAMGYLTSLRTKAMAISDQRVRIFSEALSGIKVIKLYAWESSFLNVINSLRKGELEYVKSILNTRNLLAGATVVVPAFAMIFTYITYAGLGYPFNYSTIFSSLSLFYVLRMPLSMLPQTVTICTDAFVAARRVQSLLLAKESDSAPKMLPYDATKPSIVVSNGNFIWEVLPSNGLAGAKGLNQQADKFASNAFKDGEKAAHKSTKVSFNVWLKDKATKMVFGAKQLDELERLKQLEKLVSAETAELPDLRLSNIELNVPAGSLVAIVGPVGSGKTSLLSALVGEMKRKTGSVEFRGSVALCSQVAWIQNATVRDNILFGLPFDEAKYRRVIKACCLERDFQILPGGDMTEIGERGINLSGGQKQRINLARAVYFDSDIVLLDDPLSAVDTHVGKSLFQDCICGALKKKTRILVTHSLHYLQQCDWILVMGDQKIAEQGTFANLYSSNGPFTTLMKDYGGMESDDEEELLEPSLGAHLVPPNLERRRSQFSTKSAKSSRASTALEDDDKIVSKAGKALILDEEREVGAVSWNVYKRYVNFAGGWILAGLTFSTVVFAQGARIGTDVWLQQWASNHFSLSLSQYQAIYVSFGLVQVLIVTIQALLFAQLGINAAQKLHDSALKAIFRSPLAFFDVTPLGRIVNRFSRDLDVIDNILPETLRMFSLTMSLAMSNFVYIGIVFPIFFAPLLPAFIYYYYIQKYYRQTARELRRLDSMTRSPLISHFAESLTGLQTVRAYGVQDQFRLKNRDLIDSNGRCYYPSIKAQRWLSIRLEVVSSLLVFLATLFTIVERHTIPSYLSGLVVSYALQITSTFNWGIRQAAETETNMNSTERLLYYVDDIESEAPETIPEHTPPANWPDRGTISFKDVSIRYRPDLPPILHGISFDIKTSEKVGIVGRTGAGKSSIIVSLLRLVELSSGTITIDGIDISTIGLRDLRSRIAIIPQDPVLYSGTVRMNLDPFNEYSDTDLWDVLARCDLKGAITANPDQLEAKVSESGENWSSGQRQLFCLARSMLRRARVIILDEATASVDLQTDEFIQAAIRKDFSECTIITVAHRLNTIIDYDRVLVLDAGNVSEFDTPSNLLENPSSAFSKAVDETGPQNAAILRNLAKRKSDGAEVLAGISGYATAESTPTSNATAPVSVSSLLEKSGAL